MRTVPVSAERSYQVEIGINWRVALNDWIEGRNKVVIITSEALDVKVDLPTIRIPDGEAGKRPEIILNVWNELGNLGLNRSDLIVAIGGGTVTDLAGFAAATWLRGIDWIAIPTTVAGMVDAAIGGKTGINSEHGKNLVGSFHSPSSVLIDLSWIETLSERDVAAGMAEVVKCGFISDPQILEILEHKSLKDVCHDQELQLELIHRAVSVKASVVGQDFKESYLREILNYGHTLGHAVEKDSDYELRHGEAVAIGMCFVAELAAIKLGLSQDLVNKHRTILKALKLPTSYKADAWNQLVATMSLDKKVKQGAIRFVAIDKVANCVRIDDATSDEMRSAYERISQ
jgi:3-dehydroquinate synthase